MYVISILLTNSNYLCSQYIWPVLTFALVWSTNGTLLGAMTNQTLRIVAYNTIMIISASFGNYKMSYKMVELFLRNYEIKEHKLQL
jgi:hypothetical protein